MSETTPVRLRHQPASSLADIGDWLETNMPNPALPEKQRWSIVDSGTQIEFSDPQDAVLFSLRW